MLRGVVAGVAYGEGTLMVAVAHAPTAVVIVLPRRLAVEVPLLADVRHAIAVFHGKRARHDTRPQAVGKPLGTVHLIKRINDKGGR